MKNLIATALMLLSLLGGSLAQAQTLKGSPTSIENQYRAAHAYGYTFAKNSGSVRGLVNSGRLVKVNADNQLALHDVSFPYVVPGAKVFLDRLSAQYHRACGEKLTVTSLLRPKDRQPANSAAKSVHPAGMAIDLRVPRERKCHSWLEKTLLALEKDRVIDVTRERRPPHYHVAVFVERYEIRLAEMSRSLQGGANAQGYVVRRGDTLSGISIRTGVRVAQLRAVNGLSSNLIKIGQKLQLPDTNSVASDVGRPDSLASNEMTYRVNRGDTLWDIAIRYGTSVQHLRRTNGRINDFLKIGQVLKISKG